MFLQLIIIILLIRLYRKLDGFMSRREGHDEIKVYWFWRPSCGYCTAMQSEWEKLEESGVKTLVRVNVEDSLDTNRHLAEKYQVQAVPTIIKVINGTPEKYEGDRTADAMKVWIES